MSTILYGNLIKSNLAINAKGGTEMMAERLLKYIDKSLLEKVQIHISRPNKNVVDNNKIQILWCHDLAADPENKILYNGGWQKFAKLVFVSHWQRDQYISMYGIPYYMCTVIENAIETEYQYVKKPSDKIRLIYHTTPHRGLALLYPIFNALAKEFTNIHLDVYSSFEIYGWQERDKPYEQLFDQLKEHPNITYHGTKSNQEVISALKQSHIFLYPCVWVETSCIAMIEAIKCGCTVIHSNLGALPETAGGATVMYDYTEDSNEHANSAYRVTRALLVHEQKNPGFLDSLAADTIRELNKNSMPAFRSKWITLLSGLNSNG